MVRSDQIRSDLGTLDVINHFREILCYFDAIPAIPLLRLL